LVADEENAEPAGGMAKKPVTVELRQESVVRREC